jgi:hypothetical protein
MTRSSLALALITALAACSDAASTDATVMVPVGSEVALSFDVAPASAMAIAGTPVAVAVTALAGPGKIASAFTGTVHLTTSDPKAGLPFEVVFAPDDKGVKRVAVTFTTAGPHSLLGVDKTNDLIRGTAALIVTATTASSCIAGQAPSAAIAGSLFGVTIGLRDRFDNIATGYAGTISLTTTDARAQLPPSATYAVGDAGSRAFSTVLRTTGSQTVTATDAANPAIHCDVAVVVTPAAPRLVITAPSASNAGYPVSVTVAVMDVFDNAIVDFADTVAFTSSDRGTGAVTPPSITFTGSEHGVATTAATFVTPGSQVLVATTTGSPVVTGSATSTVHGLVYTEPNTGRVRLVANPALSSAQVVQLDLVANERLEISSFFGGGPGSFTAGMNLPIDVAKAADDVALFTPGNALPLGTGTPAAIGRISASDHILYTAVSRKRAPGPIFNQGTEVAAGRVFYSVRLKLQPDATPGAVFDGAQPPPQFRAAVRDQYGDDFVSQSDFGVGKLEVQ